MVRVTKQRDTIRLVISKAGRPLSTQEIFASAQRKIPALGIATIYRTIKSFAEEGSIIAVELPGQPSRWEITPESHHHHFLCNTCDKLYEINACPKDLQRLLPKGYTLEEHNILLRGQCATCVGKAVSGVNSKASQR